MGLMTPSMSVSRQRWPSLSVETAGGVEQALKRSLCMTRHKRPGIVGRPVGQARDPARKLLMECNLRSGLTLH